MADQFYFEDGYLEAGYFGYVAEATATLSAAFTASASGAIADTTGYYIPDYIEEGYYAIAITEASASLSVSAAVSASATRIQPASATIDVAASTSSSANRTRAVDATLDASVSTATNAGRIQQASVSLSGVFTPNLTANALKNHTAVLDSQFAMSANAVKSVAVDIALENLVNLDLQAAKTTENDTALSVSFGITADVTKAVDAASAISAAFNQSQVAGFLLTSSASLNSRASALIIPRTTDERPYNGVNSGLRFDTTRQFGTHSGYAAFNGEYATFDGQGRDFLPHAENGSPYSEMAIDLWASGSGTDAVFLIDDPSVGGAIEVYLFISSDGVPRLYINTNTGAGTIIGTAFSGFNHFRILFDQTGSYSFNLAMYQNGTRKGTATISSWVPSSNSLLRIGDYFNNAGGAKIDEFRILKSSTLFNDHGWSISDTTITVPTAPFVNTEDTKILLHLDNNLLDDTNTLREYSATLSTAASLTSTLTGSNQAAANLTAQATVAADVNNVQNANASVSASATLGTTANYTTQASASLQGLGGFSVDVEALIPGDVYIQSAATLSADVTRIKGLASTTASAAASITASGDVQIGGRIVPSVTATLDATARNIQYINWLPRRSVFTFDDNQYDLTVNGTTGVSGSIRVIDNGAGQTGYGSPVGSASESHGGIAYFDGTKLLTVSRATGTYNTAIDTNDFILDFYIKPYGDTTGFQSLITFDNSANSFEFGYTYDQSHFNGTNNQERFNFIVRENSSDAATYNYVVNTSTYEYYNSYYDPNPLQPNTSGWLFLRIQRINGSLSIRMRDIAVTSSVSTIIDRGTYNTNLGNSYTVFGTNSAPTRVDLINLQIASPGYSLYTAVAQPNIQEWYTGNYQIGGELIARASLAADFLRVSFGEIDAASAFTVSASADKIRNVTSTQSVAAEITADAVKTARTDSSIDAAFTQDIDAVKTARVDETLGVTVDVTADLNRVRLSSADITSAFSVSAEPSITRTDSVSIAAQFTQADTDYIRYRDAVIETDAIASSLFVAYKVGDFFANADLRATLSVTARKTTDTPIDLPVIAATEFVVIKAVEAAATIDAAFTASTDGYKIRAAEMVTSVAATLAADADVIRGAASDLSVTADTAIAYTRVRLNTVGLNTAATISASGDRIRLGVVELDSAASILATPYRVQQAEATLTAFAFNVTAGRIIHLDPYYTLRVPQETRYIKVLEEQRDLVVEQETRVLMV